MPYWAREPQGHDRIRSGLQEQRDQIHLRPGQSLTQWDGKALKDWIEGSTLLVSNDYELELIIKMTGLDKKELLGLTGTIITTTGEKGSLVSSGCLDEDIGVAKATDVVDPTGAGDAYRARFVEGACHGKGHADFGQDGGGRGLLCRREIRHAGAPVLS